MRLFLAFLIVPLVEIALFIQVGGFIGLWPTLGIVILTAIIGTYLVRSQGLMAINQLRSSIGNLQDPTEPLAHGAMILFSGALLLTPGFFTDAVGFALLIPGLRSSLYRWIRARVTVSTFEYGEQPQKRPDASVIDGEYTEVHEPPQPGQKPSGWTQH